MSKLTTKCVEKKIFRGIKLSQNEDKKSSDNSASYWICQRSGGAYSCVIKPPFAQLGKGSCVRNQNIWGIPGMEELKGKVAFYLKLPVYVLIWLVNYLA